MQTFHAVVSCSTLHPFGALRSIPFKSRIGSNMNKKSNICRGKDLDYATEGRDEEFDSFRSVMVALTSGAVGLLFALLTASPARDAIRQYKGAYCFALVAFVVALGLLLLSYCFGWLYFDAHYDVVKNDANKSAIVKESIYAFLDNWSIYVAGILFVAGVISAGVFVFRFVSVQ